MRKVNSTEKAPAALGPYSQAVMASGSSFLFCSGQVALDPATGKMKGETAAEQCQQVMTNLTAVLAEAGVELSAIVKTTIYLADMNDFGAVNEVYSSFFDSAPPARATVEVSRLPIDARVEIDAIAVIEG
jgi:2-iminobutanoate/2-iminopropanoate deaminase